MLLLLQSNGGDGRRYRLTDFVPAGVVDIAMGLDDINDLMVSQGGEQSEYEYYVLLFEDARQLFLTCLPAHSSLTASCWAREGRKCVSRPRG